MKIRNMRIDDYDKLYSLWMSTPGMGLNDLDDSISGIDIFLKRNPSTCFVVEEKEDIIGAILCGNDGRRGYIYHTVVDAKHRKQGIATAMVKNVIDALKSEGINKVALVVFEKNNEGNKFWSNIGFTKRTDIIYRNKCISEMVRIDT